MRAVPYHEPHIGMFLRVFFKNRKRLFIALFILQLGERTYASAVGSPYRALACERQLLVTIRLVCIRQRLIEAEFFREQVIGRVDYAAA